MERDSLVAIKVLEIFSNSVIKQLFRREAAAITALEHPNILKVHGYAEEGELTYIAMDYVEGQNLRERQQRSTLSLEEMLEIIEPVASALQYAHDNDVVHRDIKPDNILFSNDGHVFLTDFGIAGIMEEGIATPEPNKLIGTPEYMSPEQAQGEQFDWRTDIYSLGAVIYEMLTGSVPFPRPNLWDGTQAMVSVIEAQIKTPPRPPSEINPEVPRAVEAVILKALAKDPNERFQSAHELSETLKSAVQIANVLDDVVRTPSENEDNNGEETTKLKSLISSITPLVLDLNAADLATFIIALNLVIVLWFALRVIWPFIDQWISSTDKFIGSMIIMFNLILVPVLLYLRQREKRDTHYPDYTGWSSEGLAIPETRKRGTDKTDLIGWGGANQSFSQIPITPPTILDPLPPTMWASDMSPPTPAPFAVPQLSSLMVLNGSARNNRFEIRDDETIIGRAITCHIVLNDDSVSRQHARIKLEEGELYLYDLNSANGVFINGIGIVRRRLIDGDEIRIGGILLLFSQSQYAETKEGRHKVHDFNNAWDKIFVALDEGKSDEVEKLQSKIAQLFCDALGFSIRTTRSYNWLNAYLIDAPTLRLKIHPSFPLILPRHRRLTDDDLTDLRDLMAAIDTPSMFALLVAYKDKETVHRKLRGALYTAHRYDFIALDDHDIRNVLAERDHHRELTRIILEQIDLTVVSPFGTGGGSTPENMFFGREREIRDIINNIGEISIALAGGRRIGKTSLLQRVQNHVLPNSRYRSFYLDCHPVRDYRSFFTKIETSWQLDFSFPSDVTLEIFARLMAQARNGDSYPIVILLDEIDGLLGYDMTQGEPLFSLFRSLSQEGQCRFVVCGERILNRQFRNPDSPLFNFFDVKQISFLEREAAEKLITEPLANIGIGIHQDTVARIIEMSGGHPYIVQRCCKDLVEQVNRDSQANTITAEHLEAVLASAGFQDDYKDTIWGQSPPLAKVITLAMLEDRGISERDIQTKLDSLGINTGYKAIKEMLDTLMLYSILTRTDNLYYYTVPAFPDIVKRSTDIELEIEQLVEEIIDGFVQD